MSSSSSSSSGEHRLKLRCRSCFFVPPRAASVTVCNIYLRGSIKAPRSSRRQRIAPATFHSSGDVDVQLSPPRPPPFARRIVVALPLACCIIVSGVCVSSVSTVVWRAFLHFCESFFFFFGCIVLVGGVVRWAAGDEVFTRRRPGRAPPGARGAAAWDARCPGSRRCAS